MFGSTQPPAPPETGQECADALASTRAELIRAEAAELQLVAHFADQHSADSVTGRERARQLGADGTPEVAEFLAAELGCILGIGHVAAWSYLRDALDLRHRHPKLWGAATEADEYNRVRVWQARKVAAMCHAAGLTLEQAREVDTKTTPYAGTLPWTRFTALVEAKIIAADPRAAEARRLEAEMQRFVATGRSADYGLRTIVARATAGDAIFFLAMCDRIATILEERGDASAVQVRRSRAIGILANPAYALELLESSRAADSAEAAPVPETPPRWGEEAVERTDLRGVDLGRVRNPATLYVHLSQDSFEGGRTNAVARIEGVGPVTVGQAREFLRHCQVTVKPVLDPLGIAPVDGYEVPERMREALHLINPAEAFPYAGTTTRTGDQDHTIPYLPPDSGGPPGQTGHGNLGRLTRYPHRVKTHASGWQHLQSLPGMHRWRTRYGYRLTVDRYGTHWLGKEPPPTPDSLPEQRFAELIAQFR
ncbi:MAG: hypothetical protein ACRDPI_06510 [Nocardioidaceae bacterium]